VCACIVQAVSLTLIDCRADAGLATSQTRRFVSNDPVATLWLSGDQATQLMRAVWYSMSFSFTCGGGASVD
jgi:hypothetical protein